MSEDLVTEITQKIAQSKKYHRLYQKTITRIVASSLKKQPQPKTAEKLAKKLLHQMWDAFGTSNIDYSKLINNFQGDLLPLLAVQSPTRERLPILETFYREIFAETSLPSSIVDLGCGLNPLSIPWMNLPSNSSYIGFDIDIEEIVFLRSIFKLINIPQRIDFKLGDVFTDRFPEAEVVFMLKLLPILEQQEKGCSLEIIQKQKAKYIIVSFPTKSLSGKQKGMADFYGYWFEELVKGQKWDIKRLLFATEMVFVVRKD